MGAVVGGKGRVIQGWAAAGCRQSGSKQKGSAGGSRGDGVSEGSSEAAVRAAAAFLGAGGRGQGSLTTLCRHQPPSKQYPSRPLPRHLPSPGPSRSGPSTPAKQQSDWGPGMLATTMAWQNTRWRGACAIEARACTVLPPRGRIEARACTVLPPRGRTEARACTLLTPGEASQT